MTDTPELLHRLCSGAMPSAEEALALASCNDLPALMRAAARRRDGSHGAHVSYSRKVFIPLTKLCRDSCHYCTFARPPARTVSAYLSPEEVLAIARAGARAGCREALFTLGDKPELRYAAAREALERLGHPTTLSYLAAMAKLVREETGLLPHLNPGVMTAEDLGMLRPVAVSLGLMLETASDRLTRKGAPHHGSPDKVPAVRLACIEAAGEAAIPFTSGILIGIGETRRERVEALLALRALHERHGHIQEIIVQNFRPKPGTRMADVAAPSAADHLWTIAVARLIFAPEMNLQAPPNLSGGPLADMVAAGINDWGGVSPVTPDHVNPEAPWPALDALRRRTEEAGKVLVERLAIYPDYARDRERWLDPALHTAVLRHADSEHFARGDGWICGAGTPLPVAYATATRSNDPSPADALQDLIDRASAGDRLDEAGVARLFGVRGEAFDRVCAAADSLRQKTCGDTVSYIVTRNINYTNICTYRCRFCAFSKGKLALNLRGRPYDLKLEEIQRRSVEAWERGATEVCLQGGIHPDYTGKTYLSICRAIKEAAPDLHIHAFSPLEVFQGAATLGMPVAAFLSELKAAGLGTLPGTAAEVLDDEIRRIICPDKLTTAQWLEVIEAAHGVGLRTTATVMYGHLDGPVNWARHLLHLRDLQQKTRGFTELVPLPFVPMETPIYLHGRSRQGPTFREAVLMHAVARLVLHPLVPNIQASWVKMGPDGLAACLRAGVNDIGGTLMDESITRSAGAAHGQEMTPAEMEAIIRGAGRVPRQRTTLYGDAPASQRAASLAAQPMHAPRPTTAAAG